MTDINQTASVRASVIAEQAFLGDIIIDQKCLENCAEVYESDFELPLHKAIFSAAMNSVRKGIPVDSATLLAAIKASGYSSGDDVQYIMQLMDITPTAANAPVHAAEVIRNSIDRQLSALATSRPTFDDLQSQIEAIKQRLANAASRTKKQLPTIRGDQVEYEPPEYLFPPYVQVGKLNLIAADPGMGKTSLFCFMAARLTKGESLEGNKCREPGNVLILSVEDDMGQLRGKLEDSGADMRRIYFFDQKRFYETSADGCSVTFNDPSIEATVRAQHIDLVVFDPFQCFLGAGVDMNKANQTRPVLAKLANMADVTRSAVLILAHNSKGPQRTALMRSIGSVDIVGAMRSVLSVGDNPDYEGSKVDKICVHVKSNNAPKGRSFAYRIDDSDDSRGGVKWVGYTDHTEEDLMTVVTRKKSGVSYDAEPVVAVLRKFITDNPAGGFLSWNSFKELGQKVCGFPIADSVTLRSKLQSIAPEIARKERIAISIETKRPRPYWLDGDKVVPETNYSKPGVEISRLQLPTEFQTCIQAD